MIEYTFEEAFSPEWINKNITDPTNELVILRQVIPWQMIILNVARKSASSPKGLIEKDFRRLEPWIA